MHRILVLTTALLAGAVAAVSATPGKNTAAVGPVSEQVRKEFDLSPFYQKCILVEGLPIVSSEKVRDQALLEVRWIIRSMLKNRPDILKALAANKMRLAVMAWDERTSDVPEHTDLHPHAF